MKPNIKKYRKSGEYLRDQFKYLKKCGKYKSIMQVANIFGYTSRGTLYNVFDNSHPPKIKDLKLYTNVFELNKKEEYILGILICLSRTNSEFEEKLFKKLLREAKRAI